MLWSDDVEEILRAAAELNTARQERLDRPNVWKVTGSEGLLRPAVDVAQEKLELAVLVAVFRSGQTDDETRIKVREEIKRRSSS